MGKEIPIINLIIYVFIIDSIIYTQITNLSSISSM